MLNETLKIQVKLLWIALKDIGKVIDLEDRTSMYMISKISQISLSDLSSVLS